MRLKRMFILVLLLSLVLAGGVSAQNNLSYGANTVGSLSATAPLAFFTFSGAAGDLVTIDVIGITPGLDPAVSLNSPTQQQLANNDNSPSSAVPTDARISRSLPQDGIFTILVSSANGAPGDFLLRLNGQPAAQSTSLSESGAESEVQPGLQQLFSFAANPNGPTSLTITTASPDLVFQATVRDGNGEIVAILSGDVDSPASLNLPAGSQTYTVNVLGVQGAGSVSIALGAGPGAAPPPPASEPTVAPPAATQEVSPPVAGDGCVVTPGQGTVNVRSGPDTTFSVVAQLEPSQTLPVIGQANGWYQVQVPGVPNAWIAASVVALSGVCDNIPVVNTSSGNEQAPPPAQTEEVAPSNGEATSAPTATPVPQQQGPSPTAPSENIQQATPTSTPSYTPTLQPTATYTPSYTPTTPVAQVAPEDARFNNPLNIQLDSTASVLDFVSYPGGDTEDRVRWDIIGMNNNSSLPGGKARLVIAVSCFGQNTDQIQFFTGGQTYACGSTIVDQEVTSASKTGSVVITAVGGQGTYVQWVLTGTATRVN